MYSKMIELYTHTHTHIYIYIYILFHILSHDVYHRILNTVSCAIQENTVVYPSYICAVFSRFSRVQLCDPIDCSLSGSSVHEILQARILEWVAMPSSRGSFRPRDWTLASCIVGGFFTCWAIGEAPILYRVACICSTQTPNPSLPHPPSCQTCGLLQ